ncbi:hypothetical protein NUACC21_44570 [Scytonema sp. NUACC21]
MTVGWDACCIDVRVAVCKFKTGKDAPWGVSTISEFMLHDIETMATYVMYSPEVISLHWVQT